MASDATLWVLLFGLVAPIRAGDLNDFSNNLATDLGPLLSLFGEAITKQYLSESTSFEDYIIFALVPLGLMTAVVSVIRVCGGTWLRSFIGRAQEGNAAIEAELCTSTSKDICEVFNRGGITRTLGRAKILEIIRVRHKESKDKAAAKPEDDEENKMNKSKGRSTTRSNCKEINYERSKENMGLFLVRDYLSNCKNSEWIRHSGAEKPTSIRTWLSRRKASKSSDMENGVHSGNDKTTPSRDSTSVKESTNTYTNINPNLSINIGIKKRGSAFVYTVLILGMILQVGLIIMAPLLSWVGGWSRNGHSGKNLSMQQAYLDNKAPILFLIGSVFMMLGMFGCAYLIGQITEETKYRRQIRDSKAPARTEMYWVQAGNQVIGDQTYGPYAYSDPSHPLLEYVISKKRDNEETVVRYTILTWIAIIATVGGYVVQFVGLRGMHAWVSIAQLAAILVMSMLRGMMRTQRLANNGNKVQDISEEVVGHELDWLAFDIWETMQRDKNESQGPSKTNVTKGEEQTSAASWIFTGWSTLEKPSTQNRAEEIFRIRARLGYLSGHSSSFVPENERSQQQKWDGKDVAVRDRAMKMAKALSAIADRLIPRNQAKVDIRFRFQVQSSHPPNIGPETHTIEIILHPPDLAAKRRGWTFDSLQLEAILGLYSWSLYRCREAKSGTSQATVDAPEKISRARILSSRAAADTDQDDEQYLLDLWLGDNTPDIQCSTLSRNETAHLTSKTVWRRTPTGSEIQFPDIRPGYTCRPLSLDFTGDYPSPPTVLKPLRFFGWSQVDDGELANAYQIPEGKKSVRSRGVGGDVKNGESSKVTLADTTQMDPRKTYQDHQ
ncbi:hypothetical protein P280DRAFT_553799 [Massarina eburnea CBS 473.64]|uniref:Uncharacterized protein n=1 Tax=Massarina eburnea CBS 473.64 TaxID=1395130 RepID=A0A6A6RK51_9PLEO|nr:hypothetical protein P280DRAFT_553799 [Massarina eburnea CBS 473.64]